MPNPDKPEMLLQRHKDTIRGDARIKRPLKGSKHTDNLYRFQVSVVRCQYLTSPFPDTRHLKPNVPYNMLSDKGP